MAARMSAAHILRLIQSEVAVSPGVRGISAGRALAERALQLVHSEVTVRSVPGSAQATDSPARRLTRSDVPLHARVIRVGGCSATAPSPTPPCNRNSGRRASTVRSLVRPGLGGVAAWCLAGSDRCSGPTLITTCSITFTGHMAMTTFGRMPTMMSTMACTVLTPTAALTLTAPMPIRTDTMAAGARAAARAPVAMRPGERYRARRGGSLQR
jgi:hypothetical protein